jgi:RimJ/RimL family protein N-acetyltransferase
MQNLLTQLGGWWTQPAALGITVRPLQPDDAGLIYAMHLRSSAESIYYRYLQFQRPTLAELERICHLDPQRGAGFVATQPGVDLVVGLAYYLRDRHTPEPTAEPGILVEDGHQGQGIGRRLWQELQQHAQTAGIRSLRLLTHPNNQRMARLVEGGGLPYSASYEDGLREYRVELRPQPYPLLTHQPAQPATRLWPWQVAPVSMN